MKITRKNLDRAWNRALLILHETHPTLARSLEGQDQDLDVEGQTVVFTCGLSISDRMAIRLALREAYGELGADIASILRDDPAWPAVETYFPEEVETRVSEPIEAGDAEKVTGPEDAAEMRESMAQLKRMSRWLNVRAEIDKDFASGEEPIEFTRALREFLEDPTDWESRLPVLIYSAIDRSLTPAE